MPLCGRTDPDRDAVELQFVKWALADQKPVLAVCRGFQVLNVACGGTLFQDVGEQYPDAIKHDYFPKDDGTPPRDYSRTRGARRAGTRGSARYLGAEPVPVNSMHHQGIKRLAPGLARQRVGAGRLIEGVEGTNGQFSDRGAVAPGGA